MNDTTNSGLSGVEAARRLEADGPNELPGHGPRGLIVITGEVLTEPMFLLLLAAAAIYVVLGDLREAIVLAASILVVILITIVQERRTETALAKLRDLSSPRALVIRDGREQRIAGRDVVVGDLVVLREGDRIAADARVLSATQLSVDESIVTGESLPVDKRASTNASGESLVFSGCLIVSGFGTAEVTATGARSEIGRIGRALTTLGTETTPLFREVRTIVRWVATAGLLLCAAIAVIYGSTRNDWLGGVLAGITVAMGVLPEEFPVVLTVFLAMGAWRISRANVLARRMPAVESIGAVTVLAVDKTGTLTENRMRLALIETLQRSFDLRSDDAALDSEAQAVLHTAMAASERDAFDPMERAIHEAARRLISSHAEALDGTQLIREYDITPELLAVTHVWRASSATRCDIAVKGAPETVFDLCRVDAQTREKWLARAASLAGDGLRVLAVATGEHDANSLPDSPHGFDLHLLGLICLADPLRPAVPTALAECSQAGIRVVMITGDHPGTALAIARQAGFDTRGGVLTGVELESLSDEDLRSRVRTVNIYARAKPTHKLRLVEAFKSNAEIIAMTGDGVNDAPALKAAHVGVAMGGRGTDVAREAAALVLLDDNFASLVGAVRLGRRIYSNIRHAMSFIMAVHIPIAGMGLAPVLMGWPLLLYPMHVLFLEFLIDPACAFVFEADPEAPDTMRRPPRSPNARLFSTNTVLRSLWLGIVVLAFCIAVYSIALKLLTEPQARALSFIALVVANLALIFVTRSHRLSFSALLARRNNVFWWITLGALAALLTVLNVPSIADLFRFDTPPLTVSVATLLGGIALVLIAGRLQRPPW